MQQSATGATAITANATIASATAVAAAVAATAPVATAKQPPQQQQQSAQSSSSSMDQRVKDGAIHFSTSQQQAATTTSAQVITVVASSTQSTDMISSSQPLVVVPTGGSPYIAVAVTSENDPNVSQSSLKLEESDETARFDEYGSVYSNGSNSAGQMAYYQADTYPASYYNPGEVNMNNAYLVMDQTAANGQMNNSISSNCSMSGRESNQSVIGDEEYNKSYQPNRMSVQPQTINWLMENYETADGVSLPRSTLYAHYQQHCQQNNLEAVNAASFGKLIRSVFMGLRTRRLGTRGNSKYHYYGIRVRSSSVLNDSVNGSVDNSAIPPIKKMKPNSEKATESQNVLQTPNLASSKESLLSYLGNANMLLDTMWPNVPIESQDESQKFMRKYRAHYDRIIKALSVLGFHEIETIWLSFWQAEGMDDSDRMDKETMKNLAKTSLQDWITQTDYTMYNSIISSLLLPNLLKQIPQALTQQIRNFAKCIDRWMRNALSGYDECFIQLKLSAVSALSHMLRRYTSLNHLSTAACSVLKNQQQVQQMISDLNRVDFKNVQEQASWVCECRDELVCSVEHSFKKFLQEHNPYERWAKWCEEVLDMCLSDHNITAAKQFFFKWEFYSSLVMRDLTLRSAQSFGSFHLLRLLYDEYIFYLIEQRIAKSTGKTPLQMLGDLASSNGTVVDSTGLNHSQAIH